MLILATAALCAAWPAVARADAPSAAAPVDVAPDVEETRLQKWPRAAWCEGAACWLVAWREGDVSEKKTDIWCARIAADGKALDPAGIRITSADGVKDRPMVASGCNGFLVAWQDLRNGTDWDVYAARVSAEGNALDPDGFLVHGGADNQCAPTVTFAGGNYLLAWQAFLAQDIMIATKSLKFGGYEIRGARVSAEGKVLDIAGNVLAPVPAFQACLAADGGGNAWLAYVGLPNTKVPKYSAQFLYLVRVDASTGAPAGGNAGSRGQLNKTNARDFGGGGAALSVACTKDGSGILAARGYEGGTTLFPFDKDGRAGTAVKIHNMQFRSVMTVSSLAADGEQLLLVRDWPHRKGSHERPHIGVSGYVLSPEGTIREGGTDGFPLAVDKGKDRVQSFVCAGSPGKEFLLVYSDPRAPENTKVVARLLR